MTVQELAQQLQKELTGDIQKDMDHLRSLTDTLRKEPNAAELLEVVAEVGFRILPEEEKQKMQEQTFVRGKRLDQAFGEALQLVRDNKMQEAEEILAEISDKIAQYFETDMPKYFSFRNPFEYHMYREFYPNDKAFDRAPFDFAHYLQLYGYVLLENRKVREAKAALERAARFNPVSADVRFEMAELCKFAHDQRLLLAVNQETLRLCTTADRIARVLANMGYYCYVAGEYRDAAIFYYESLRFLNDPPVEHELQDVLRRMKTFGQKFTPPTRGQIIDTYDKYNLQPPPNDRLVNLAIALAESAKEYGKPELQALFTRVAYDLTNEQSFLDELNRLDAELQAQKEETEA